MLIQGQDYFICKRQSLDQPAFGQLFMLGRVNTVAKCPGSDRDGDGFLFFLAAMFSVGDEFPQRLFKEIRVLSEATQLQESIRDLLMC